MRQIRKSLFETNSSSTHAVVVTKENHANTEEIKYLWDWADGMCFGRCESAIVESLRSKIAYAYIVAKDLSNWSRLNQKDGLEKFLKNLYAVSEKYFIKNPADSYEISEGFTKDNLDRLIRTIDEAMTKYDAYVDHVEDFAENGFFERLTNDKDFVERLIFDSDSYITVGGDEYRGYNIKTIGFQYDYDYSYKKNVKREIDEDGSYKYIDPADYYTGEFWRKIKKYREKFDVYFKGN